MVNKHDNFTRIATKRVNRILKDINSLKAFKNTSFYQCDKRELQKIVGALEEAVTDLCQYYFNPKRKEHFEL